MMAMSAREIFALESAIETGRDLVALFPSRLARPYLLDLNKLVYSEANGGGRILPRKGLRQVCQLAVGDYFQVQI